MLFGTADAIQILKKWRGVANEGEKAVIAVRTGSPMSACEWQHEDDDETYRSDGKPKCTPNLRNLILEGLFIRAFCCASLPV